MDIDKLTLFISLAETLSFHRCAEVNNVSPSTLSRNIQHLEQQLNTPLFIRDKRSVALTPQGVTFLGHARQITQQWDTAKESMQVNAQTLLGTLSIYCSVTASYSFMFDMLANFRSHHPKVAIKLHTGDPAISMEHIRTGEEDIAIAAKPANLPRDVQFKRFSTSQLLFIAPQDDKEFLPSNQESDKTLWSRLPLILSERGLARDRLNQWFSKKNVSPNIYAQVAGNEAIVSMVSLGLGVGLVPKIVLDNSPLAEKVKVFERQPDLQTFEVGLCVLKRRLQSPIVKAFWELAKEH